MMNVHSSHILIYIWCIRSHRQATSHTDGTISNVTMPAVIWRQEFGESNITVGVSRLLLNSFDIDAGEMIVLSYIHVMLLPEIHPFCNHRLFYRSLSLPVHLLLTWWDVFWHKFATEQWRTTCWNAKDWSLSAGYRHIWCQHTNSKEMMM